MSSKRKWHARSCCSPIAPLEPLPHGAHLEVCLFESVNSSLESAKLLIRLPSPSCVIVRFRVYDASNGSAFLAASAGPFARFLHLKAKDPHSHSRLLEEQNPHAPGFPSHRILRPRQRMQAFETRGRGAAARREGPESGAMEADMRVSMYGKR